MPETDLILMSLVIFVPALFALALVFFPRGKDEAMRWWTLFGTALTLGISLCILVLYLRAADSHNSDPNAMLLGSRWETALKRADLANANPAEGYDWVASYRWIPQFNINYSIGLDGISLALVVLTTGLSFLAMIASWNIEKQVKGYCILFLLLETGMVGTFLALDFFLFYIFWEVMLLPMYFLIGVWGGPRREYAAIKFFLYTLLGSVLILIAILGFYFTDINVGKEVVPNASSSAKVNTFDIPLLQRAGKYASNLLHNEQDLAKAQTELETVKAGGDQDKIKTAQARVDALTKANPLLQEKAKVAAAGDKGDSLAAQQVDRLQQPFFSSPAFQITMFLLLFIGFAIKVPLFPFHTWLPDAHVEAPTPISMILAGVLLKMGGYGIIRLAYPICPWAAEYLAWWVSLFGIINIVYGAFAAMAQTDFKKLVAYSSISHMGYVVLGVAVWSAAAEGAYWSWGMNGAMFQMLAHGITSAGMFFLVGVIYDRAHHRNLDNFRGLYEPMPLYSGISAIIFFAAMGLPGMCGFVGEFMVVLATWNYDKVFAILAALTVVITAAYILWTIQRVYLGTNPAYKGYKEITWRELACIVPLVVLSVLFGILPSLVLSWMEPSVTGLVKSLAGIATGP